MTKSTTTAAAAFLTLDQTIAALEQLKASGVAGTSPVAYPTTDNNCAPGFMQRVEHIAAGSVVKVDFDKGYGICKAGSRGGVAVVVIA